MELNATNIGIYLAIGAGQVLLIAAIKALMGVTTVTLTPGG